MKILIAHSNASYIDATREFLKAKGEEYQASGATGLQECLTLATRHDVLVLDSDLLKTDTEEALHQLSLLATSIPIVVLMEDHEIGRAHV